MNRSQILKKFTKDKTQKDILFLAKNEYLKYFFNIEPYNQEEGSDHVLEFHWNSEIVTNPRLLSYWISRVHGLNKDGRDIELLESNPISPEPKPKKSKNILKLLFDQSSKKSKIKPVESIVEINEDTVKEVIQEYLDENLDLDEFLISVDERTIDDIVIQQLKNLGGVKEMVNRLIQQKLSQINLVDLINQNLSAQLAQVVTDTECLDEIIDRISDNLSVEVKSSLPNLIESQAHKLKHEEELNNQQDYYGIYDLELEKLIKKYPGVDVVKVIFHKFIKLLVTCPNCNDALNKLEEYVESLFEQDERDEGIYSYQNPDILKEYYDIVNDCENLLLDNIINEQNYQPLYDIVQQIELNQTSPHISNEEFDQIIDNLDSVDQLDQLIKELDNTSDVDQLIGELENLDPPPKEDIDQDWEKIETDHYANFSEISKSNSNYYQSYGYSTGNISPVDECVVHFDDGLECVEYKIPVGSMAEMIHHLRCKLKFNKDWIIHLTYQKEKIWEMRLFHLTYQNKMQRIHFLDNELANIDF